MKIGARTQIDEVRSGEYHIYRVILLVQFGRGTNQSTDVTVRWPQDRTEPVRGVEANHWIVIGEGKGVVASNPLGSR